MKLVIAIVNKDDANSVAAALLSGGFHATKLATTGGFLRMGNTTFLVGVDEKDVGKVTDIIKQHSSRRMQMLSNINLYATNDSMTSNVEVAVGGATIFVVDVEKFEKI